MRKVWALVLVIGTLLAGMGAGARASAGERPEAHWAASAAAKLKVNWLADLDKSIGFKEWYVLKNQVLGSTDLVSPGELRPTISRQEAIVSLLSGIRFIREPDQTPLNGFVDGAAVGEAYRGLMATAVQFGLVLGYPGGELRPAAPLTHGEAAALLERAVRILGVATPGADGQPGSGQPAEGRPGSGQPGSGQPAGGQPGSGQPAGGQPGSGQPAEGQPGGAPPDGFKVDSFGAGLVPPVPFKPEGTLPGKLPWAESGGFGVVVHGVAYTAELPTAGRAPAGNRWVVLDLEVVNDSATETLALATGMEVTLEDAAGTNAVPTNPEGTAALASPFTAPAGSVAPGGRTRGLVAFVVADGRKQVWFAVRSTLGHAEGKPGWNAELRGLAGDMPE